MGTKIVFIIPGFRHKPSNSAYIKIIKMLKSEGYTPIPITIPWKQKTISQNTNYFIDQYRRQLQNKKMQTKKIYFLGFSFGAMIAFIASTKLKVNGLILCSLSPYFKEDVAKIKKSSASSLQKYRYQDFTRLHSARLAKQTNAKHVSMLYGTQESESLIVRVKKTYRQISSTDKYLLPIKNVEHDLSNKKYLQAIHQIARSLH